MLIRSFASSAFILAAMVWPTAAQDAIQPDNPKPPEIKITELTLSPKAAATESLRLRLLPVESELTPGDSVPVYLRLGAEMKDDRLKDINDKSTPWLDGPISELPIGDVRKFVDSWSFKTKQMEFAARRKTSEWNYTIQEQREEAFMILLPDAQEMRTWARLLAIKARLEIAEKDYVAAARTIETGLSMGRQVGEGPFLIMGLVGIAIENIFLNRVEEFISQPDAPNLYWALTALPRPLVSLRKQMEIEQAIGLYMMPELVEPTGPRTESEWSALLVRLHRRWVGLVKMIAEPGQKPLKVPPSLATLLAEATAFFKERGISTDGMGNDQITLRYIAAFYRERRDQVFQASYLPYPEAAKYYKESEGRNKTATGPVAELFAPFMPALAAAHKAQARLDRRIAALRIIEALRMQAAADGGELASSLDKLTIVPIPNDPLTGQPFEYRADGESRSLSIPKLENDPGLLIKLTARKPN